jgi:hypothetical protein
MDALLTRAGWWTASPAGYVGPTPDPPAGPRPHRAVIVETQQWVTEGPAEPAEAEAVRRLGPEARLVLEPLEPGRVQVWACDGALAAQVETWPGLVRFVPYARALRAALMADAGATPAARLVVEPVGAAVILTAIEGRRVRACRWVDVPPDQWGTEALRTLHGAGVERVHAIVGPPEVQSRVAALGLPFEPLPHLAVALRHLSALPSAAWFLSTSATAAALAEAEHARSRSRRLVVGGLLAVGLGVAAVSGGLRIEAAHTRRALESREAALRAQIDQLAVRAVAARPRHVPLDAVVRLITVLPADVGLRELTLTPGPDGAELELVVAPTGPAWRDPARLATLLRDVMPGSAVRVAPVVVGSALLWQARLVLPARGGA